MSDTDEERSVDDQFRSLMEGLRTSLPGVQVLFAFLLTAPLHQSFDSISDVERVAFATAFCSSGLGSVLLIAPSVHQRVRAPASGLTRRSKRHLIWATWIAIAGTVAMVIGVAATVFLVSSLTFESETAAWATAAFALVTCWSWFYVPLVTFRESSGERGTDAD